jgi:hypothetical protein
MPIMERPSSPNVLGADMTDEAVVNGGGRLDLYPQHFVWLRVTG